MLAPRALTYVIITCGYQVLSPHKTWHTTLLAEVGANAEGPLPWIERDYTPISTWSEWEKGKCDILIKVYPDGAATSWLHKQVRGSVSLTPRADICFRQPCCKSGPACLQMVSRAKRCTKCPRKQSIGASVWLSQPKKTMNVPSLTLDNRMYVSVSVSLSPSLCLSLPPKPHPSLPLAPLAPPTLPHPLLCLRICACGS